MVAYVVRAKISNLILSLRQIGARTQWPQNLTFENFNLKSGQQILENGIRISKNSVQFLQKSSKCLENSSLITHDPNYPFPSLSATGLLSPNLLCPPLTISQLP